MSRREITRPFLSGLSVGPTMLLCLSTAFVALVVGVTLFAVGIATTAVEVDEMDNVVAAKPAMTAQAGGGNQSVAVTLRDFTIILGAESAKTGEITFNLTNLGPDFVHEFTIIQTDLAPDELPTEDDGSVDEAAVGLQVHDAIEDIPVGQTRRLTTNLEAGSYAMVCNVFAEPVNGEQRSHYAQGMRAAFTVE
jgi:hypothetical protein